MRTLSRQAAILHSTLALSSFLPPLPSSAQEPTAEQVAVAKRAFQAFDAKQLPLADALFTQTIDAWRELDRGVEEMTALLVARAGVR